MGGRAREKRTQPGFGTAAVGGSGAGRSGLQQRTDPGLGTHLPLSTTGRRFCCRHRNGPDLARLPNIRELGSLLELQCAGPAINRVLFSNAASTDVWSSSPSNFHTHYSWYVDFATGALTYGEREKPKAIRLVRDAQ
ncbi:Lcl C-terminal domain-containing protein [Microbulbifer celer]|uniref:DUF1566 domain-containing protein n=1 Tax=Microbulbifer celer TaxID=435905 RepID=A0ABW3U9U0_9GAMM